MVIKGGVGGVRFRVIGVRSRLGFTVRLGSGMRGTEVRDGDFRRGQMVGAGANVLCSYWTVLDYTHPRTMGGRAAVSVRCD